MNEAQDVLRIDAHFPRYERFFDTSLFSSSGRFLALTRLPFEVRLPQPGDAAEVVVVDLATGTGLSKRT